MYFSPTCIFFYNKINKVMEVYFLPCQKKKNRLMIKYYLVKSIESTVAESVDAEMSGMDFHLPSVKKFDKNLLITPILKLLLAIMNVVLSFEE